MENRVLDMPMSESRERSEDDRGGVDMSEVYVPRWWSCYDLRVSVHPVLTTHLSGGLGFNRSHSSLYASSRPSLTFLPFLPSQAMQHCNSASSYISAANMFICTCF
jgi:hypothetical protein